MKNQGKVYLVGAGPGDPLLITLKGKMLLESCDAVVYDYLAPAALLDLVPPGAEKFYVGKKGGEKSVSQASILSLLIKLARAGKKVVRLKGGDPYIFGRGGEEAVFLKNKNVSFETVPGITAALGAAASAGIPLTHRSFASQVTFITAHEDPGKKGSAVRWDSLAKSGGTLVFYMGMKTLPEVVRRLAENGMAKSTPAAVVQWATTAKQRTVTAPLGSIVSKARAAGITAPALTVIGRTVSLAQTLAPLKQKKPLLGRSIVITRARRQASELRAKLETLGAEVIEYPTIRIEDPETWAPVDAAINKLVVYDWIVFTSVNGVEKFLDRAFGAGHDARSFSRVKLAAVGPATAQRLAEFHLKADLVPDEFTTDGLLRAFAAQEALRGKSFLLVRANIGNEEMAETLRRAGASVDEIAAYRNEPVRENGADLKKKIDSGNVHCVTFTSSSTVKNFVDAVGPAWLRKRRSKVKGVSIGPVTSETAKSLGVRVMKQATEATIDGLIQAIVRTS